MDEQWECTYGCDWMTEKDCPGWCDECDACPDSWFNQDNPDVWFDDDPPSADEVLGWDE